MDTAYKCKRCDGKGWKQITKALSGNAGVLRKTCKRCRGQGFVIINDKGKII